MTETITFTRFGETHSLDVVGQCEETGLPLVEMDGKLTGVTALETQGRRWSEPTTEVTLFEAIALLTHFRTNPGSLPTNLRITKATADSERYQVAYVEVAGVTWIMHDNGGEFMVGRVNLDEYKRAVPLTWHDEVLNAATVAGRIADVLLGQDIDYEWRLSDEDEETLKAA